MKRDTAALAVACGHKGDIAEPSPPREGRGRAYGWRMSRRWEGERRMSEAERKSGIPERK